MAKSVDQNPVSRGYGPVDFRADLLRIETNLSTLQDLLNNTNKSNPLPSLDRAEAMTVATRSFANLILSKLASTS